MKTFARDGNKINVAAHLCHSPDGMIVDTLILLSMHGDEELCRALFGDVDQRYRGKSKMEWDNAEIS